MKKLILIMAMIITQLCGWEINTHRAIDRQALKASINLAKFVENAGIKNQNYDDEWFDGYGMTYLKYIEDGEEDGISNRKWKQLFIKVDLPSYQKMIEAGAILEDAQWPANHTISESIKQGDGRFVNHFYDAQDGGRGLNYLGFQFQNVLDWGKVGKGKYPYFITPGLELSIEPILLSGYDNDYSYDLAYEYFDLAFSLKDTSERKRYQAKMFVTLGHLMHLMNDMTSTAHTRGDAHAEGDPMEVWGRGGIDGKVLIGYRIVGSKLKNYLKDNENHSFIQTGVNKYDKFDDFITKEAEWTSTHFFSKDTIFKKPKPSKEQIKKVKQTDELGVFGGVKKFYYVYKNSVDGIPKGTKLAIHIESYTTLSLAATVITKDWMGMDDTTKFKGDYSVLEDNAAILLPRAIENAKNFLNYFFRGSMKVNSTDEVVSVINDSNENLVASPSVVTFKNGTLKFYCDDENDNRSEFHSEDIVEVTTGDEIASVAKDTLYAEFKDKGCSTGKNVTILYDGTIGSERGLSVIVISASDIIPSNDGGGDDSGDNTDDNNTGGDTDNGGGADNDDGSENGDNNATDPTKDPNKVCVSNYFKYYGDGKIHETLKKGDKDAELYSDGTKHQVKELQEFLQAFGYDVGSSGADGWFGSDTESALMDFQSANGLDADGIVGPNTRDAMNSQNCYDK